MACSCYQLRYFGFANFVKFYLSTSLLRRRFGRSYWPRCRNRQEWRGRWLCVQPGMEACCHVPAIRCRSLTTAPGSGLPSPNPPPGRLLTQLGFGPKPGLGLGSCNIDRT